MTLLCCFVKLFKLIVNSFTKIKVSMEKTTLSIILIQRVIFRIVYTNVTSNSDVLNNAVVYNIVNIKLKRLNLTFFLFNIANIGKIMESIIKKLKIQRKNFIG